MPISVPYMIAVADLLLEYPVKIQSLNLITLAGQHQSIASKKAPSKALEQCSAPIPLQCTAPRGGLKYRKKCRVSGPIFSD